MIRLLPSRRFGFSWWSEAETGWDELALFPGPHPPRDLFPGKGVNNRMTKPQEYLCFANKAEWRAWLEKHHDGEKEAWLIHYKKGAGNRSVTYEEAVEEALCFGWIDGLLRRLDGETFVLRYSPRKRGSIWAARNRKRAEKLIREGRMTRAGLDKIAEAGRSGEWEAAAQREDVNAIPVDLERALKEHPGAGVRFKDLPASRRKQLFWWITTAKKEETRKKRVKAVIDMVASGGRVK